MPTMIFVNLPVENLERSAAFYNKLGFPTNPQFSDQNATNAVISDTIVLMLLVKPFFRSFINKEIADTATSTTAIVAISRGQPGGRGLAGRHRPGGRRHPDQGADGPGLHVLPQLRRPGRPPVRGHVDGPGRGRAHRLTNTNPATPSRPTPQASRARCNSERATCAKHRPSVQTQLARSVDDGAAIGHAEFAEHSGDVVVGGLGGDEQPLGDLGVRQAAGDELGDVELPIGQSRRIVAGAGPGPSG